MYRKKAARKQHPSCFCFVGKSLYLAHTSYSHCDKHFLFYEEVFPIRPHYMGFSNMYG